MAQKKTALVLRLPSGEVKVTSPDRVYFPKRGYTKRDVVEYYLAVASGAVRGIRDRPLVLKRFVKGIGEKPFFQKRAPKSRPDWIETAIISFASGRTAEEVVVRNTRQLIWCVNLGCLDLNPHATTTRDLDAPNELRIDLDPNPGIEWSTICDVAFLTREVLSEHGLVSWPKTSGSRGFHVLARIRPDWGFRDMRKAALAVAVEVERRGPGIATTRWAKEERVGVFLDYNQNAKDSTVASAYSIRPLEDARVSAPLFWDEVADSDPAGFTILTMPDRFREIGDPHEGMDTVEPGDLSSLIALADEQKALGTRSSQPLRFPLLTIANHPDLEPAMAGLERWKTKYPDAAKHLEPADILVDKQRGRYSTWTRIRVNLRSVPQDLRPIQETPDPDEAPTRIHYSGR